MAGEAEPLAPASTVAGAAPEPSAVASPAAAAPAPSPEPVAPAVVEPAAPAAPVAEPAAPPAAEPTLLAKFDADQAAAAKPDAPGDAPVAAAKEPEAPKPGDPPKPADAPKPDVTAAPAEPAAPAPLPPVEYKYELPETIRLDDGTRTAFHGALDAFRADPAAGAQGLIDLHNQALQQYADHVASEQRRIWNDTNKEWQNQVKADEQLGGAGHETTMGAVARMRDLLVAEPHRAAFDEFLQVTGAGNHPEFLRILHNAARLYDEAPMAPPNARPAPNGGKPPSGRLRDMYNQPRGQS